MREQHRLRAYQCGDGGGNVFQLLMRPTAVERPSHHASGLLVFQSSNPHLEELIEVGAEDGAELDALQ